MFHHMVLLVPVLLPTLVIRATCENETNSDVFVNYSSHAEADYLPNQKIIIEDRTTQATTEQDFLNAETSSTTNNKINDITTPTTQSTTEVAFPDETEGVVFVPNEAPVVRLEDEYDRNGVRIKDVLWRKTVDDVMDGHIRIETEAPQNEIVFVPGSNNENTDKKDKEKEEKSARRNEKVKDETRLSYNKYKLDCSNLDCNNSMKSICGGKIVNRKIQYRLFLNDCYFRKVNCNFKYEINRYTIVSPDKCVKFGVRGERPFSFTRKVVEGPKKNEGSELRRSFSSRRSMSMNIYGKFCSHPCPVSCPEDYEPECAVSATGQHRVFMNHCKLDDNSCLFSIVWHLRPLSECVGGKKADMRQNRFFIGWMHQVGILDNKGKLVLQ